MILAPLFTASLHTWVPFGSPFRLSTEPAGAVLGPFPVVALIVVTAWTDPGTDRAHPCNAHTRATALRMDTRTFRNPPRRVLPRPRTRHQFQSRKRCRDDPVARTLPRRAERSHARSPFDRQAHQQVLARPLTTRGYPHVLVDMSPLRGGNRVDTKWKTSKKCELILLQSAILRPFDEMRCHVRNRNQQWFD